MSTTTEGTKLEDALADLNAQVDGIVALSLPMHVLVATLRRGGLLVANHLGICSSNTCAAELYSDRREVLPVVQPDLLEATIASLAATEPEFGPCKACGSPVRKVSAVLTFVAWDDPWRKIRESFREMILGSEAHLLEVLGARRKKAEVAS